VQVGTQELGHKVAVLATQSTESLSQSSMLDWVTLA
jgi:hypothetical protein